MKTQFTESEIKTLMACAEFLGWSIIPEQIDTADEAGNYFLLEDGEHPMRGETQAVNPVLVAGGHELYTILYRYFNPLTYANDYELIQRRFIELGYKLTLTVMDTYAHATATKMSPKSVARHPVIDRSVQPILSDWMPNLAAALCNLVVHYKTQKAKEKSNEQHEIER